ncbi:MAG: T9SS type A sorting domain-containing protein, partial [Bacteroidota bacterium]
MKKIMLLSMAALTASFGMAQQVVPNGGFEAWDSLSFVDNVRIYNPQGWGSYNASLVEGGEPFQPVQMTTDAHSGNYAVKISSKGGTGKGMPGVLFTGEEMDPEKGAGFSITGKIDKVEGYYKYAPDENDSATIVILFFKDGEQIGGAMQVIKKASGVYTKFSLQLEYGPNAPDPDAAKVYVFAAGPANDESNSVLYLDDLNFIYKSSTGMRESTAEIKALTLYPSPASNTINVLSNMLGGAADYVITDMQGKIQLKGVLSNNEITVRDLATGIYLVKVVSRDGA